MSDVWSRMARNPNLSSAQFPPDSFHAQSLRAADEISWKGEEIDSELGTVTGVVSQRQTRSPEADAHRELARSIDTWATDAELSPVLNSGYRRWN